MASSLNKVMLIGNLGKDAETRHTPSGTAVTNFAMATTTRYKDQATGDWKERTEWHDVVLWRGENVAPYLRKGKKVFVEGRLQTRSWEGQDGQKRYRTEVVCDPFGLMLLGGRDASSGGAPGGYSQGSYSQGGQGGYSQGGQGGQGGFDRGGYSSGGGGMRSDPVSQPASSGGTGSTGTSMPEDDDDIPF